MTLKVQEYMDQAPLSIYILSDVTCIEILSANTLLKASHLLKIGKVLIANSTQYC